MRWDAGKGRSFWRSYAAFTIVFWLWYCMSQIIWQRTRRSRIKGLAVIDADFEAPYSSTVKPKVMIIATGRISRERPCARNSIIQHTDGSWSWDATIRIVQTR
ncbi:hypothetical protein BC830DRAFT_1132582 [Chytriomyces sp. MP71]|nr:hypothetical protein BC830DRAFT_1132582 [Chytriomyces sp. MP71]